MSKQTKIVATVSDKRCDVEFVRDLFENGMNVVRMNSAHLDAEGFNKIITNVRAVSNTIAILMDTKGPEMRTTAIADDGRINFSTGDYVKMSGNPNQLTTKEHICISYPNFVKDLSVGSLVLIDDGEIEFKVIEKHDDFLLCIAENEGELGSRKALTYRCPHQSSALTEKDRKTFYMLSSTISILSHTPLYAISKTSSIYKRYSMRITAA